MCEKNVNEPCNFDGDCEETKMEKFETPICDSEQTPETEIELCGDLDTEFRMLFEDCCTCLSKNIAACKECVSSDENPWIQDDSGGDWVV